MSSHRLTTVNRLGEGRSQLFQSSQEAWAEWDRADNHRALFRYASLINLHDGRVMALFADGDVEPPAGGSGEAIAAQVRPPIREDR